MASPAKLAFYDLDGTLLSSNVVTQYAYYARNHPSRLAAAWRCGKLILSLPLLVGFELYSRRRFNIFFYRFYRGIPRQWLAAQAEGLFSSVIRPAIYPGAEALVAADRAAGYHTVLVTGSLDFALEPIARHFGFDELISNSLVFRDGVATGEIAPPLIAAAEKAAAIRNLCRKYHVATALCKAYSDSMSDLPMLEAVGHPVAANPQRRLRRLARQRGWPILDLKRESRAA